MYLITGASKGIGKYLRDRLLHNGFETAGTCRTTVDDASLAKVDVSDYSQVQNWINNIEDRLDKIVLINCAAINQNGFTHKTDPDEWKNVINVNLLGTYNVIRALLPIMRRQRYGRIINFSSVVAQVATPGVSAYAASKAALWGLTRSVAAENAKMGITINCLNLGYFDIGIIREVPAVFLDEVKKRIPSATLGDPEHIYRTIKYIVETPYINGTSIDLSAGMV